MYLKSILPRRVLAAAIAVVLLPGVGAAEEACTLRRSVFFTSDCPGQLTEYVYETIVCPGGNIHWHGHVLSRSGSCMSSGET